MAPKSAPVGDTAYTINGVTMTASDMKLIFGILNSLTAPIEADMDAAAAFAGYTVGSFKKMWPTLKKKCNIDSVSGTKQTSSSSATPAATTAEDDSGEVVATPKKTPGGRGARGRPPANKKVPLTEEAGGGPSPLTPGGVPAGMKALSVADADAGSEETPETPSKSIFGGGGMNTSTSAKKRTAADAADADPDADLMDQTPAKKKPARKPRVTAKQKREAAAAAAAAAAEAAAAETAAETAAATSDAAAAGSDGDKNIDVAMKDDHGGSDSGEV
ncbi:hypothetical protein GE21DRAFT_3029 [Neurospora crassa]|uniref:Uncharacterized protein n=2 Tax=Neurospora crassa TaxID=5141 RepID=Q1K8Q7_NEUCR|nr:hypothetical protein NCU05469 [Neurospora crassa OR74A]EAA34224.1 hypothetical protein NCU05469 [Neurospora crassa OR74A]KHE85234.1 hypothetical protein GE21DRAFT_3029 [Neurospora crassa]CAB97445.1 hypothetical protein [Neurospora crassa]|eukprot:XP_963460.1 hypothetical protein NCU05469 [Neurospora crassa OR74A]